MLEFVRHVFDPDTFSVGYIWLYTPDEIALCDQKIDSFGEN